MKRALRYACLAMLWSVASPARADEPKSASEVQLARELGKEGILLAQAGKCADAKDKLVRAAALVPAPTILTALGECQIKTGTMLEGLENLRRSMRETLAPNSPQVVVDAQKRARTLFDATLPRVPRLTMHVTAPANANYVVKLDGQPVPPAVLGVSRPTDPGEHTVEGSGRGLKPAQTRVTLAEREETTVTLTLEVDANAPPEPRPVAAPERAPEASGAAPARSEPSRAPLYIALAVTGVGVAVGATFGILALDEKKRFERQCVDKVCPETSRGDLDTVETYGTVSTIGFATAGAGAVAAGVFWFLGQGGKEEKARTKTSRPSVAVTPWLSHSQMGVQGRF